MNYIFLVDCNSFYASCEMIFRPDLAGKPVVVLSNNDGFIIAANSQAKSLGYKTIEKPFFMLEQQLIKDKVEIFSANFELYGAISKRVMRLLSELSNRIEVYSIDEAFLEVSFNENQLLDIAFYLRKRILDEIGVPVSVGISMTKTLAKAAMEIAKKRREGVFYLKPDQHDVLSSIPVNDVWGVGQKYGEKLIKKGVKTALDLSRLQELWAREHMTVVGLRCVKELNGVPCIKFDSVPQTRKTIQRSASFGHLVFTLSDLKKAISIHCERAGEKLREDKLLSLGILVHIHTNPHLEEPQYGRSAATNFAIPTADTPTLIKYAHKLLEEVYLPGYRYLKTGVLLFDLIEEDMAPGNLFRQPYIDSKEQKLMNSLDAVNTGLEQGTLAFASSGIGENPNKMRQSKRSPRYLTRWSEIPEVKAK